MVGAQRFVFLVRAIFVLVSAWSCCCACTISSSSTTGKDATTTSNGWTPLIASSIRVHPKRLLLEDSEAASEADEDDDTSSSSSAGVVRGGVYSLVKPLVDGDVELRSFRTGKNANFCHRAPVVVTKSTSIAANGGCPAKWTQLSCSCMEAFTKLETWEMHVTKRDASDENVDAVPLTTTEAVVRVSSIGIFIVPHQLVTLKLVGDAKTPLDVDLRLFYEAKQVVATTPTLVIADTNKSSLTTVEVSNIDLAELSITSDFLPTDLVQISLQNCNLATLDADFLSKRHATLQVLDLSRNRLKSFNSAVSGKQASAIKDLDLSSNDFSSIPSSLVTLGNLETLNLRGNPIANFNVTKDQFTQLSELATFEIDAPDSAAALECSGGEWQSLDDAKFCVLLSNSDQSKEAGTTSSESSGSTVVYLAIGIAAALVALAVIFFVLRKRCANSAGDKPESIDVSLLERTDSPSSMRTIDDALLKDPVILMHRIPYKEIVVSQCINQGAFGVVYSGVYKRRRVAIKKIRAGQNHDILRIESFLKEICLMASLSHPRIVEFIGVSWDSLQNVAAVTEFMDRGDLREVLQSFKKRGRSLSWGAHKTRIALHIAEALLYLHSLDPIVIHRDLKSKNVLLDSDLDAKLSDFGISREWTVDDTHMTVGIGTSFWIAPEVLLGKKYDERADVFSFGVVLSEIDTDDYPYWDVAGGAHANQHAILRMVAAGQVRPKFTPDCPDEILKLADLCLQGDPQKRLTSHQLVCFLQQMLANGSEASALPSLSSFSSSLSNDSFLNDPTRTV